MDRGSRIVDAAFSGLLALWAGASAMVGVVAAITFPIMRELDVRLPAFAAYPGDHWRLAAGRVLNTAFTIGDMVGAAAAGLAFLALIGGLLAQRSASGLGAALRYGTFAALLVVTAYTIFVLRPDMDGHLEAYWAAVEAGDFELAATEQASFNAMHGPASTTLAVQLALTLACVAITPFAPTRRRENGAGGGAA